jgi:phenylpyruvate tautomerase PptA (4-oxalocrotonate tautomerase family)
MPIVTITVRKPKTSEFKNIVLDAVGAALVGAGASPNDRFQRVIELSPDDFRFDPTFPDLSRPRTDDFVLIELLLGIGRSVKVKKKIVADIIDTLSKRGFDGEHVMIVFQDVPWENWSPGGGRIPHA